MTWAAVAAEHTGHRCILEDERTLRCVDCSRKLILPRDTASAPTPTPNPYRRSPVPGVPMPAGFKDRVMAEIRERKKGARP